MESSKLNEARKEDKDQMVRRFLMTPENEPHRAVYPSLMNKQVIRKIIRRMESNGDSSPG